MQCEIVQLQKSDKGWIEKKQSSDCLRQQNAKNLVISAKKWWNKKVTQNCNTYAGKFMDGKIPALKGAKQGGM